MPIIKSSELLSVIKDSHILLDTSVFIDAFNNPKDFAEFFNELKENGATLVTLKVVLIEFIRGALSADKFAEKQKYIEDIIDTYLPVSTDAVDKTVELAKLYGEDGKTPSVTDFLLGGTIMQYRRGSLLLMTSDAGDFPLNVFNLDAFISIVGRKTIKTCGFYSLQNNN